MKKILLVLFILAWASAASAGMVIQKFSSAASGISDNFSSDTSSNYTDIANGMVISGGAAYGSTNWANNVVYHTTALSSNHWGEVTAEDVGYGLLIGYDSAGNDGYAIYIAGTYLQVRLFTDGSITTSDACTDVNVSAESAPFTIKASWNGSDDMDVWINGTQYVTNCDPVTDYAGTYIGLVWSRTSGTNKYLDDLSGDSN